MAEVKWIRLTLSMFDDEKIKIIESMPDGDTILIIWVKLLILAGKVNDTGYVYLSDAIPYTDEMLATIFRRPLTTVRLALQTFEKFGMIETASKGILIVNWEKHQNIDGMERIKELTRNRVQKHRQKQLTEGVTQPGNVTVTLPVTLRNATDIDIDIKNKNKENIEKKVYGEFKNVLLSDGLPDISRQEDSTTPVLPQSGDSTTPVLPVGNREWGIGSREKEKESNKGMSETLVSDESLRLTNLLKDLMLQNDDKAKIPRDLTNWAQEMDKINRLDHRSFEVIEAVIKFSQSDSFWKTNVLSPSSLRKNFPKLYLQQKKSPKQSNFIPQQYKEVN
ncbi:MAG: phage replisome organizer N-terminal domain-containing protein [Limnochordia bacterium]|nr:phage replisome organizer N-terminal domain-containing protein [Limnochordia bacterium]